MTEPKDPVKGSLARGDGAVWTKSSPRVGATQLVGIEAIR